jgi:hypothetical protein
MLREFIDGLPLDLVTSLLPGRTRLRPGLLAHLHLHARAQKRRAGRAWRPDAGRGGRAAPAGGMTQLRHQALLDSLRRAVQGLRWEPAGHWVQYGHQTSYTQTGAASKRSIVSRMLDAAGGTQIWDIGANVGTYSDLAAGPGRQVLAFDQDAASVEHHWRTLDAAARISVLPLVIDLTNPSPSLGWALEERRSLLERGPADVVMALALVHHLAIGSNLPLTSISRLLAKAGRKLIIEFVPKDDPMTQQLLAARPDIFPGYTLDGFRSAFATDFRITDEVRVEDSLRTIFLMESRAAST